MLQQSDFIGSGFWDKNYPDATCEIVGVLSGYYQVARVFPGGPGFIVFMSAEEINEAQQESEGENETIS